MSILCETAMESVCLSVFGFKYPTTVSNLSALRHFRTKYNFDTARYIHILHLHNVYIHHVRKKGHNILGITLTNLDTVS